MPYYIGHMMTSIFIELAALKSGAKVNGKLELPSARVRPSRTRLSVMQADAMRSTRAVLEQRISERRDAPLWLGDVGGVPKSVGEGTGSVEIYGI